MKLSFLRKNLIVAMLAVSTLLFACKASDSTIQKAAQAQTTGIDPGVTVTVNEGVVTLTGQVEDQQTKDALATAVKTVKGVKSVVNNTLIASPDGPVNPDDQIRAAIEENFLEGGVRGVNFTVASGVVTLTGEISRSDLTKVMQAANEAKPKKINNQLKINN